MYRFRLSRNWTGLLSWGTFGQLPTLAGYHRAIAGAKPFSAPGPGGIGLGVYRHPQATSWAISQYFHLGMKQRLCFRARIQNRGGGLFVLIQGFMHQDRSQAPRLILGSRTDPMFHAPGLIPVSRTDPRLQDRSQAPVRLWQWLCHGAQIYDGKTEKESRMI